MSKNSNIFLIGGATATTKSTMSLNIMKKHNIVHKLGTGFLREMCKIYFKKKDLPSLYNHSFGTIKTKDPFKNLYLQSLPINKMIKIALQRAEREGTSIIIEGVNVIPGLTNHKNAKKIILAVRSEEKHKNLIFKNKTHLNREVKIDDFKRIRIIQNRLINLAKKNNWKVKYI